MKKSYLVAAVAVVLVGLCCCGFCCKKNAQIAVVDVQRIVAQARPVVDLRQEMQGKMSGLQEWVKASNSEIDKADSQDKKDALTKKYQLELAQKQQDIQQDYAAKLQQLDTEITKLIEETAKSEGFSVALIKASVAAGGVDITDKVIAKLPK
jgi:Skp family chaperone for outer membrane proteins